jgi:rhodanese-related sulfurtransferase
MMQSGEEVALVDVREPGEHAMARIEGAELVPMGSVPMALGKLEEWASGKMLVVFCHHGVRSLHVVNWLRGQGLEECLSLAGGIDRWSREIDPGVPLY